MSLIHTRGPARIDANLTPLIDLSFLLIVFFILVPIPPMERCRVHRMRRAWP